MSVALFGSAGNLLTATNTSITVPVGSVASIPAGALILVALNRRQNSVPAVTMTGYTSLRTTSGANCGIYIYYKIAAGGEGNVTASWTGSVMASVVVAVYTGVDTTSPFLVENGAADASVTSVVTTPSVTNTDSTATAVGVFGGNSNTSGANTFTPDANMTERQDVDSVVAAGSAHATTEIADRANAPTGAQTYAATFTGAGVGNKAAWLGFLRPTAVPTTAVLAASIPSMSAQLAAASINSATLGATMGPMSAQLAVAQIDQATVVATLPSFSTALAATQTDSGSVSITLPSLGGQIAGGSTNAATVSASLPGMSGQLAASQADSGTLGAVLGTMSAQAAGTVSNGVALAATLPSFGALLSATQTDYVAIAGTLPSIGGQLAASSSNASTMSATLGSMSAQLQAVEVNGVDVELTLPGVGASLVGDQSNGAAVDVQLPSIGAQFTGGMNLVGIECDMTCTFPGMSSALAGRSGTVTLTFNPRRVVHVDDATREVVPTGDDRNVLASGDPRSMTVVAQNRTVRG